MVKKKKKKKKKSKKIRIHDFFTLENFYIFEFLKWRNQIPEGQGQKGQTPHSSREESQRI